MHAIVTESTLTCPQCGFAETLQMPSDACLWFHQCNRCNALLRPRDNHCCVFCSYGSVPCPPVQAESLGLAIETCDGKS